MAAGDHQRGIARDRWCRRARAWSEQPPWHLSGTRSSRDARSHRGTGRHRNGSRSALLTAQCLRRLLPGLGYRAADRRAATAGATGVVSAGERIPGAARHAARAELSPGSVHGRGRYPLSGGVTHLLLPWLAGNRRRRSRTVSRSARSASRESRSRQGATTSSSRSETRRYGWQPPPSARWQYWR